MQKGKAIRIRGHRGPKGFETSRLLHFLDTWLTDGGDAANFTRRSLRNIPVTYIYQRLSQHK
jgi:hypothetical protein